MSSLFHARCAAHTSLALLAAASAVQLGAPRRPSPATGAPELPSVDFRGAIVLPALAEEKLHSTDPEARDDGARELVARIEESWPDDHRRAFLVAVAPEVLKTAVEHCVPPSVTLAQAVLESGWGRSGLAQRHNNLFGLKAGASERSVALPTTEHERGREHVQKERFRAYDAWGESIEQHSRLLADDARYAHARPHWDHWPLFLETVAPVYATDPSYVRRVSALVEDYRLDEFDALVTEVARKRSDCAM